MKKIVLTLFMTFCLTAISFAQTPHIISVSPEQNELNVSFSTNISVTFDIDMNEATINNNSFIVNSWSTGLHQGTITYDSPLKTATLNPDNDFDVGEVVTVTLTTAIQSSGGAPLASGYIWSFTTVVNDGTGTFDPDSVYAVGNGPWSVFAADLDGDGDIDISTANAYSNDVSVLLNNGDGTFAAHSVYSVGDEPWSVFAADLNNDGDIDLITANMYDDNVSVLLNDGDGGFAPQSVYAVDFGPVSVFAADLDGDGHIDLATADIYSDNVSVLLNNGNGTFASHSLYPVGDETMPVSVFAADLDVDGDLDLITANYNSDNVSVLMNNGDGTFASYSLYPLGGDLPLSVFAADVDGDGYVDLIASNCYSQNVSVLLNIGDGTFAPYSVYPTGDCPWSVFASDLDSDGDLDLVTSNEFSNDISVLLNSGDGTFDPHSDYPVGDEPYSIFAADLDDDGDIDLATSNKGSDNVSVLLNEGGGPEYYEYLPGDANMFFGLWPPQCIGGDVTYLVNYFRGIGDACELDGFWASADANGDCNVIGSDVTRLVNYFRGNVSLLYCPDYEPAWLTPDDLPDTAPSGWPNCEVSPVSAIVIPTGLTK